MKSFKVNFKLQHVSSATKPIQVILSLGTKYNGKYLTVEKSTGMSLLENEWDASRRLPRNSSLATKFIRLEESVQDWLNELSLEQEEEELSDEQFGIRIAGLHQRKYFHLMLEDKIKRIIEGKITEQNLMVKQVMDLYARPSKEVYTDIMIMMRNFNYSIVDSTGKLVDMEKFFSNIPFTPEEMTTASQKRIIIQQPSVQNELIRQDERYSIPFYQYVIDVANKKVLRELLQKEGAGDYKQKLSAQFKLWNEKITIGDMTDDIAAEFFFWLKDTHDFSANYFANFKKWMKSVLRWAKLEDKLQLPGVETENLVYQQNKEKVSFPYLTEEMLQVLINMQFDPSEKHLEYTRDLFYLASYTGGLTFGDLSQAFHVQSRNVEGHKVNYISVTRNKTGVKAEIPLMDSVYEILKKYNFKFKEITNQHYNRNIQRICEIAEFKDDFVQTRLNIKTKTQQPITTPFYQLIGSHTARRNFCTNFFYHRKMEASLIMQFSQHTKLESFLNYVKASANIKFDEFAKRVVISERME
ncbi:MAG: hypothetical protein IPP51_00775 [Bacteroidetes bacterium]|nr:hypothetical protein [Bacteroidota bacterium]